MKTIWISLLLSLLLCSSNAAEPEILASGEWSERVTDTNGRAVRGRLLIGKSPKNAGIAVYLELQDCSSTWGESVDVYCNMTSTGAAVQAPASKEGEAADQPAAIWAMRNAAGKLVPQSPGGFGGGAPGATWVSLPCDSTVRLRASVYGGGELNDGSLSILFLSTHWLIPAHSTEDFYLSCTFTFRPPAGYVPSPERRVWEGTIKFPSVKIPSREKK